MLQIIAAVLLALGIYDLIYFLIDLIVGDSPVRGNTHTNVKDD